MCKQTEIHTSTTNNQTAIIMMDDDEQKKKIEETRFLFIVAASGVGKTFTGDYLESIMGGWKHMDGDFPHKNRHLSKEYRKMAEMFLCEGEYKLLLSDKDWFMQKPSWEMYLSELARLTLEAALETESNNQVVLSFAALTVPMRNFLRQLLTDAGAKDVTTLFLKCDKDVHHQKVYKRFVHNAEESGKQISDILPIPPADDEPVIDYKSFSKYYEHRMDSLFEEAHKSDMPYFVIDNTPSDQSVLNNINTTLGLLVRKGTNDKAMSYSDIKKKIQIIDQQRDANFGGKP